MQNARIQWEARAAAARSTLKLYRSGRGDTNVGSMNQSTGFSEISFYRQLTGCLRSVWIACDSFRGLFIQYAAGHPSKTLLPTGS